MNKKIKNKKCKICQTDFQPFKTTQKVCSIKCAILEAQNIGWKQRKTQIKEKVLTQSGLLKSLQNWINKLIRSIDKDQPCISSGRITGQMQAGHFWTVGAYPSIRFHLFNIWGQSSKDNNYLSGNISEYRKNIELIFGKETMDNIENLPLQYKELKLQRNEILSKIELVKELIKEAKNLPKLNQMERIEIRKLFNQKIGIYK